VTADKYEGLICCLLAGLLVTTSRYYPDLATSALTLFLFRTFHLRVEPEVYGVVNLSNRKLWLLFILAGWQPIVMW
jgi:hypothetical protein